MFITKKAHAKEVDELNLEILNLKEDLREARDLKSILEKMVGNLGDKLCYVDGSWTFSAVDLPQDVLRYVDDILGGQVIKQEGNKCLVIEPDGSVKTGLTKQKADKGFSYKLIRKV